MQSYKYMHADKAVSLRSAWQAGPTVRGSDVITHAASNQNIKKKGRTKHSAQGEL